MSFITKKDKVKYWLKTADQDWKVANHLFEKKDYSYAWMQQDLFKGIDYETPPNQRPTLSSYLLWVAMQRNIEGANLWASVPFYLIPTEDPRACRKVIDFFNKRLDLGIDFSGIDDELMRQNEKIAWLIDRFPEFNDIVHKLESNLRLTDAESRKIVELMEVDFQGGN